jgi:hypothetical protein
MTKTVRNLALGAVVAFLVWLYGAIHVLYGEKLGLGTCWKHGWSFSETFVDYDGIAAYWRASRDHSFEAGVEWDHYLTENGKIPSKTLDAMRECKLVEDPGAWDRDKIILYILLAAGALGVLYWGVRAQKAHDKATGR